MENKFTVNQAALLYDVSYETVRRWSIEFSQYLSPTATPSSGRQRLFTEDDMRVLALIADLKAQGSVYADIHAALKSGQRGETPPMLPDELSLMITGDNERKLSLQIDYLQLQIEALREENERLKDKEKEAIRHQIRNEMLQEQLEEYKKKSQELQVRLDTLLQELGETKGELKVISRDRQDKE